MSIRKCLACGKEYDYCPRCDADQKAPWMTTFDCPACKEIVNVVSGFNMGLLTEADVKEVVDKYGISDISIYQDNIKDVLKLAVENVDIELKTVKKKKTVSKGISK